MRARAWLQWTFGLACAISAARAEVWQTTQGDRCDGTLSGIYGPLAVISGPAGATELPVEFLDEAGLGRVADYLAAQPRTPPPWAHPQAKVAKSLRGRLQVMQDGKLVAFDPGARPEPQLYLVYFGAHWCRPCREFSPSLVQAYRELKQLAPDLFELVFVSWDRDADEQKLYIRELGMPWPVLKYSGGSGGTSLIERRAGPAIPSLVVLTRDGDLIFDSFHGTEYVGPQAVLQQATALLQAMAGHSDDNRRAFHRLAILQYLRASAGATASPKPYLIALDRSHYQTLEVKKVNATLAIDEHGRVTDAKFDPPLPTMLDYSLGRDAEHWLFLPALDHGRPKATRVVLPLDF